MHQKASTSSSSFLHLRVTSLEVFGSNRQEKEKENPNHDEGKLNFFFLFPN